MINVMHKVLLTIIVAAFHHYAQAQRHEIYDDNIVSLQVVADNNWMSLPIIELKSNQRIYIDFDDLTHVYHRYAYKIEHCESDWQPSTQLFESDYIGGFANGNLIEDISESINTNTLYTHYSFSIPNRNCFLKMSGNYRIIIYDDNDDERIVATAYFMVLDKKMGVDISYTTNTDVGINSEYQQINMQLKYGQERVTNPLEQIKTVVLQNQQWHDARTNVKPQYIMPDGLRWEHCLDYIFNAGNEYHKFEILDPTHPTMGIDQIIWDGDNYQVYPFINEPTNNYIYDEDANGSFLIRNSENYEIDRTSEYVIVNFELKTPYISDGSIYINGVWTNDCFLPKYKMRYDNNSKSYKAQVMLKQGYYSYQYLLVDNENNIKRLPSEGNFYQTENSYQALVYFRPIGGRTDLLVGYSDIR